MTSKKKGGDEAAKAAELEMAQKVEIPDPEGYNTENYQCLRNAADGSMYYGEVGYQKIETGNVVRHGSDAYTEQIKPLSDE